MPKIDLDTAKVFQGSGYPEPYASQMGDRTFQLLGVTAGLTEFGVDLVTLQPGATSSLRHWHSAQDEFAMIVEGELTLVEDDGKQTVRPGDCIGWPKNSGNGHHLKNHSGQIAKFLVVGTKTTPDICTYSDVDLEYHNEGETGRYTRRGGAPLPSETES